MNSVPARGAPGFPVAAARPADFAASELTGFTDITYVVSGGDSTIYRAYQPALDRDVAIKVVNLSDADDLRRFEREIALTVKLGRAHPNIVTVLDTRRLADGRPCIVMDFFELGSTHDRVRATGPFGWEEVVSIGRVIADALGFAHQQRIVHRDVKPQNILILPTSYVLADFGIARSVDSGHTGSLERLSYRHASPEVLDGQAPEPTDDLWSLCSTMSTLLEGRAPFASDDAADDTALAYLRRVRMAQRRPLPADTPGKLVSIIEKGLHPERGQRYQSAAELIDDLRGLDRITAGWAPDDGAPTPLAEPELVPPVRPVESGPRHAVPDDPDALLDDPDALPDAPDALPDDPEVSALPPVRIGDLLPDSEDLAWAPGAASKPAAPRPVTGSRPVADPVPLPEPPNPPTPGDDDSRAIAGRDDARSTSRPVRAAAEPSAPARSVIDPVSQAAAPLPDSPADDAAPTGLRPALPESTPERQTDDRPAPSPRVRARIAVLAIGLLAASAIGAYFITRPSEPAAGPGSLTAPITSVRPVTGGPAGTTAVSVRLRSNDPAYQARVLSIRFDGNIMTAVVTRPQAEDAQLLLFDATEYDPTTAKGTITELTKNPVAQAAEGNSSITVPVPAGRTMIRLAVMALSPDGSKSGMTFSEVQKVP